MIPTTTRVVVYAAVVLMLPAGIGAIGCGDRQREVPYEAPKAARNPTGSLVRQRCRKALEGMLGLPLDAQFPSVFQACANLYVEPSCRQALLTLDTVEAEARAIHLAQVCKQAYCGKVPSPKPELCGSDIGALTDGQLRWQWARFNWRVFKWDLGTGDPLGGVAFRYLESVSPMAAAKGPAPVRTPVRITLSPTEGGYTISAGSVGTRQTLGRDFSAEDIGDFLLREAAISKATPLELAVEKEGSGLTRLMRGASEAGYAHFSIVH